MTSAMVAVRALQRRVARLERFGSARPSPIAIHYGSIDEWVDCQVIPDIKAGKVCRRDMVDVVAAIRSWERDGYFANRR